MEAKYGYVKVIAEKPTGRVLGAEIVGKDAGELIHIFSVAVAMRATVRDLAKCAGHGFIKQIARRHRPPFLG